MKTIRWFVYLYPIFLALWISFWNLENTDLVYASHASTGHSYYVHSSVYNEKVCVESAGSSISQSTARTRVQNTLRYDNPSSDWHALANNRIFFEVNTIYCGNMTSCYSSAEEMLCTGNVCYEVTSGIYLTLQDATNLQVLQNRVERVLAIDLTDITGQANSD